MKKQSIVTMAMVLGLAGSVGLPAQAATGQCTGENAQVKGYVVVNGQVSNLSEIKGAWKEWCAQIQNGNWAECPIISLPNGEQTAEETKPEVPENNQPEVEVPKEDNTEETTPEVEQPENSVPDNNESGETDSQPETDNQELSYAEQVVKLVNAERAKAGLSAVEFDQEIALAATIRAKESKELFSHTRPDGRGFSTVLTDNGIRFNGAGENIAWGQKSPEQVMEAWMNSDGHRANILNAKFTKIGVGHYQDATGTNYWAQLFTY